jgi:hypothetical protein
MTQRISSKTREALGRLSQVIACADRALTRDVLSCDSPDEDEGATSACEEGVNPRRDPLTDGAGKRLLLRVV